MKNFAKKFKKSIMFLFKLMLFLSALGLYVGTYKLFYEAPRLLFKDNYVIGGVYLLAFLVLSLSYQSYRIGVLRLREMIYSFSLAAALSNILGYCQLSLMLHRFINVFPLLACFVVQSLSAAVIYIAANGFYFLLNPPRSALAILCDPQDDRRMLRKFLSESKRYHIVASCHGSDAPEDIIKAIDAQPLVLLMGHGSPELRNMVLRRCYETDKRLLMVPTVEEIFIHEAALCQIDDIPAFLFRNHQMNSEQRLLKRLVDLVLSAAALLILSPVMGVTALLIHLYDGGPVLFKQRRVTLNGQEFLLLKFRSMVVDAEKHGARLASQHDDRITPVGRWIRRLRIDELPQLINILKGDMSIVGPRPERPELVEEYCKSYPEFRYRLKVKAGLTGYAQVFGRYNTLFEDKLKLDLLYIQNFSLTFDFYIMLSTIKVLFMPSSSQGVKS
ncbi:MAG: sugar transferase [Pyramidobacter sp.]|jgi:exopolysaccharide biosynthesis polyprenyl glycosylphosphotransferase